VDRSASSILLAVSLLASPVLAETGTAVQPSALTAQEANLAAPIDPPEVGIPFGCGMSFPVSQVHNIGSHVGNDTWAWDFRMPEGTPVVAALDGVVRLARGDSDEGGCDPAMARKANYVVIESAGNLETQYLHFSVVSVIPGQHVRRGDLLGYSGKTGWACGAHLHFKVATPTSAGWNNPSTEARLTGYGDPALEAWVSSPPCTAPLEVATHQPPSAVRQGDPVVQPPGEVNPRALSAAGSAGEAAISVGGRARPGGVSEASRSAPGAPADRGPLEELPLSATGVPFLPSIPSEATEGSLAPTPENAWSASQPAARPTTAAPAADAQPRDTEGELLEDAEVAPARR
jgi:Peptidase family M23